LTQKNRLAYHNKRAEAGRYGYSHLHLCPLPAYEVPFVERWLIDHYQPLINKRMNRGVWLKEAGKGPPFIGMELHPARSLVAGWQNELGRRPQWEGK
jgi:hypothetical protein